MLEVVLDGASDPAGLGRRIARKTLLAVAGSVSVHDHIWTTDRSRAARRWSDVHQTLEAGLDELVAWANGTEDADEAAIERSLNGIVASVVAQFATDIGLWPGALT